MPITEVFNTLVNDLHYCSSLQDFDKELKRLSERREMYKYVYNKFHSLYEQCYKHNEDGSVKINYSAESYCASILCALRNLKIDFITDGKVNLNEINEYYFTKKIFKGVESFSNKLDLKYILLMDNKEWKI